MFCKLKGCGKCGGDLVLEQTEWRCWQCGRYYYPERSARELLTHPVDLQDRLLGQEPERKRRKDTRSRRINSAIAATDRSDSRWWDRNRQVITYLDQGKSIREIAEVVGAGPRQIRNIRDRLSNPRTRELVATE